MLPRPAVLAVVVTLISLPCWGQEVRIKLYLGEAPVRNPLRIRALDEKSESEARNRKLDHLSKARSALSELLSIESSISSEMQSEIGKSGFSLYTYDLRDSYRRKISDTARERDEVLADLRSGRFCSKCGRSKREFEKLGQDFYEHVADVKGTVEPAPPEVIRETERRYAVDIAALEKRLAEFENKLARLSELSSLIFHHTYGFSLEWTNELKFYVHRWKMTKQVYETNLKAEVTSIRKDRLKILQLPPNEGVPLSRKLVARVKDYYSNARAMRLEFANAAEKLLLMYNTQVGTQEHFRLEECKNIIGYGSGSIVTAFFSSYYTIAGLYVPTP